MCGCRSFLSIKASTALAEPPSTILATCTDWLIFDRHNRISQEPFLLRTRSDKEYKSENFGDREEEEEDELSMFSSAE
jgi:hypothetical protein